MRVLAAALLVSAMALPAQAARVAFSFGGFVEGGEIVDTHGILDGSITDGTRLTGRVEYESSWVDIFPGEPDHGLYAQPPPTAQIRVSVGSYAFEVPVGNPITLVTLDDWRFAAPDPFIDAFDWRSEGDTFPFPGTASAHVNALLFVLETTDTSVLSSDALPTAVLDIADFPNPNTRRFAITGCLATELDGYFCVPTESIGVYGVIDTLPEPGVPAAGTASLAVLSALARRPRCGRRR